MWGLGEEREEGLLVLSRLRVHSDTRTQLQQEQNNNNSNEQRHWVIMGRDWFLQSELTKKMALVTRRNAIRKGVVGIV